MIRKLTRSAEEMLDYFFVHPTERIHLRGLEKKTGMKYSSIRKSLIELCKEKLVKRKEETKMVFFSVNGESKEFIQLKRVYNIRVLYRSRLLNELVEKFKPDSLVVFGSFVAGLDNEKSDIDICVINGRDVSLDLKQYESLINRRINLIKIKDPKREKREFRNTLANGYVLYGYLVLV